MLPPFHGERMRAHRDLIARARGGRGRALAARHRVRHPPAHAGAHARRDHARRLRRRAARAARRDPPHAGHDDVAPARAVLLADRATTWASGARSTTVESASCTAAIRAAPRGQARRTAIVDELIAAGSTDDELRDQLVTLLAAGHETTAGALAWALERLARHPDVARAPARRRAGLRRRRRQGGAAHAPGADRRRAQAPRAARASPAGSCPPASTSRPASTSPTAAPSSTRSRPRSAPSASSATSAPDSYAWIPFGGGVRRCVGAAFAAMEMSEVLRAVAAPRHAPPRPARRASACAAAR